MVIHHVGKYTNNGTPNPEFEFTMVIDNLLKARKPDREPAEINVLKFCIINKKSRLATGLFKNQRTFLQIG